MKEGELGKMHHLVMAALAAGVVRCEMADRYN